MLSDRVWTRNRLTAIDLVELFVSKPFWHSHVKKYCSQVSNHPLIVEWLENEEDIDVWGIEKSNYTFKDLIGYLEQAKEKGKEKEKSKKKSKANQENNSEKRSHKKGEKARQVNRYCFNMTKIYDF